ncbi:MULTISPECIES: SDR family oxidoreductase [unclassified Luteimonas]
MGLKAATYTSASFCLPIVGTGLVPQQCGLPPVQLLCYTCRLHIVKSLTAKEIVWRSIQPIIGATVNNLGIHGAHGFFDIDDALRDEFWQVNVMSGVRLGRHYAKGMRARGWGRIQFVSSEDASQMEARFLAENRPSTLLRRFADPEEVAAMCVYIASPQASATTGAALRVEGGIVESIA